MRNKRWHIRRALVADLRTDPMVANSRGRTVGAAPLVAAPQSTRAARLMSRASHLTPLRRVLRRVLRRNSRPACS